MPARFRVNSEAVGNFGFRLSFIPSDLVESSRSAFTGSLRGLFEPSSKHPQTDKRCEWALSGMVGGDAVALTVPAPVPRRPGGVDSDLLLKRPCPSPRRCAVAGVMHHVPAHVLAPRL